MKLGVVRVQFADLAKKYLNILKERERKSEKECARVCTRESLLERACAHAREIRPGKCQAMEMALLLLILLLLLIGSARDEVRRMPGDSRNLCARVCDQKLSEILVRVPETQHIELTYVHTRTHTHTHTHT